MFKIYCKKRKQHKESEFQKLTNLPHTCGVEKKRREGLKKVRRRERRERNREKCWLTWDKGREKKR
jgi:hypothetical protein